MSVRYVAQHSHTQAASSSYKQFTMVIACNIAWVAEVLWSLSYANTGRLEPTYRMMIHPKWPGSCLDGVCRHVIWADLRYLTPDYFSRANPWYLLNLTVASMYV